MQPRLWHKLLIIPPVAVGLAVVALVVSNKPAPARKPPQEAVQGVRVLTVRPLTFTPRITGYGTVRPARIWQAVAQVGGKVARIHPQLKKGTILKAGTEIITIADDDYRLAVAQAESGIRALEAKLNELAASEENTRTLLRLEREALAIAERDHARKQELLRRGTIPQTTFEQSLKTLINQRKLVATLENTLRLIPVQRRELQAQLDSARNQLASARLNLERTRIILPFDARIAKVDVEVNQFVPAGRLLAQADGIAEAEVEARVPLQRMQSVMALLAGRTMRDVRLTNEEMQRLARQFGLHVEVRLPGNGNGSPVWKGRFARMSDTLDAQTRTLGVIGVVNDPYGHVRPGTRPPLTKGMFVRMDVLTRPLQDTLLLPRVALRDNSRVFVADAENRLRIRPVKVRARLGALVVIGAGLKPGERVVLSDLAPAMRGQLLKPVEDDAMWQRLKMLANAGTGE